MQLLFSLLISTPELGGEGSLPICSVSMHLLVSGLSKDTTGWPGRHEGWQLYCVLGLSQVQGTGQVRSLFSWDLQSRREQK